MDHPRVLVIGASCQVGHFLLPQLRDEGVEVHAASRRARPSADGTTWHRAELPGPMPGPFPWDGILCFAPLDAAARWLSGLEARPAAGFVATSSMSVLTKKASTDPAERALVARLEAGEGALRHECDRLGMAWSLIRPTLVYGAGLDRSLTPIARRAMRWRVFPLPRGNGWRQPVHAADVAEAAWRALRTPAAHGQVFELGGGERLRAGEMFARVRDGLPRRTLGVPVGRALLRLAARVLPAARGPVSRLDSDLVADNTRAREVLGVSPRGFAPDVRAWRGDGRDARREGRGDGDRRAAAR